MKFKEFDELLAPLLPFLSEVGFTYSDGCFERRLPNGIRHILFFDLDPKSGKTFRLIAGFGSKEIHGERRASDVGVFGVRYVSTGGWADKPSSIPCYSRGVAVQSLNRVAKILVETVIPWMDSVDSICILASLIESTYPYIKGKLLLACGDTEGARECFRDHLEYLRKSPNSAEKNGWIEETERLIDVCNQS